MVSPILLWRSIYHEKSFGEIKNYSVSEYEHVLARYALQAAPSYYVLAREKAAEVIDSGVFNLLLLMRS
jgi:predicted component of viral defense system (DUF524 family)